MSIAHSHLLTAEKLFSGFYGKIPFPDYARQYFRAHRQHGSRDRKSILSLCYAAFRMGASLPGIPFHDRAVTGLFLQQEQRGGLLGDLNPEWNALLPLEWQARQQVVHQRFANFKPVDIFPWTHELGGSFDPTSFSLSHLKQPSLYVRLRPGRETAVMAKLQEKGVVVEKAGASALRLAQGTDLAELFVADRDLVVQDLSSQRVTELLDPKQMSFQRIWDCCAGSGGKALLMHDLFPNASISASDLRPSILSNLTQRFHRAGISKAEVFVANLERSSVSDHGAFDLVVADVPCTGSGTWGRNPEWLVHFNAAAIADFARRQLAIAQHAAASLKPGGYFLYITCSVFRRENEAVIEALQNSTKMVLEEMKYLAGYEEGADTLFAARFILPA